MPRYVSQINSLPLFLLILSLFLGEAASLAQQKISGTVTGSEGARLAGVTIFVKGNKQGVMTDTIGSYEINAQTGDILVFSYIGYNTREIQIEKDLVVNVKLLLTTNNLNEVVVTGYMNEKIKEITGSVTVVKSRDLTEVPAGQVEQMLQGKVAGLNVITSGEPGSSSIVRLHGVGNFGDVTPLYIIDGLQGDINTLNPYDVESLSILKDAGAYSIYGVRGANGVIVVTTKKGRGGRTSINFSSYVGLQEPLDKPYDLLSPKQYGDLIWLTAKNSNEPPSDALFGSGPQPVMPDYLLAGQSVGLFEGDPRVNPDLYSLDSPIYQIIQFNKTGTDWFHELFKPAWSQNYVVSASGGNDKNHYLVSLGYLDQQGTYVNTYLKRFTGRVNSDFTVKNSIRIGENLQISYSDNPKSNGSIFGLAIQPNYIPVYDIKGNWSSAGHSFSGPTTDNPLGRAVLSKDDRYNKWQIFGNAFAEADLFKHFTLRTSIGGNFNFNYAYNYTFGSYDHTAPSSFLEYSGYKSSWTWTNTLNYSERFGEQHSVKVIVGTEQINNYTRDQGASRVGYFIDDPNYRFLSNGGVPNQNSYSVATSTFLTSFFAKADYGFRDKYFISATIRQDGSSIFGPQNRFGWFPAIGAAWRISQENFLKSSAWLTELKIRASWGKTGFFGNTDPLNQFTLYGSGPGTSYYDIFGTSNSTVQGFRTVRIGNPKTGWEQDIVSNLGFESILWNGNLSLAADYYFKQSTGLLFQLSLPDILGSATRPNANVGNVLNQGIDLTAGSKGKFSRDWSWDLTITFTTYNNKIVKLNDIPQFDYGLPFGGIARNKVGHPMGSFYGYKITGFFQDGNDVAKSPEQPDAAPGRFKYLDANHDGHISQTDSDMVFIGNPNPKFTLGLNIGLTFKNIDLAFFYGSFGNDVENDFSNLLDIYPAALYYPAPAPKSKTALYNSWSPTLKNPKAPIQESLSNFSTNAAPNSYPIENGSYFRSKSIMIGYSLPGNWLQKLKIDRLRFYAQVLNLFTFTKYSGPDPELSGNSQSWGYDGGSNYPNNQKQYLIGVNLNF